MGKAARWFRGIFSRKSSPAADSSPAKGKNKWGFGKSFREKGKRGKQTRGEMSTPLARVSEERNVEAAEWSKRAFAVAAADAAVAAAQASATVVRLTGSGSGRASIRFGGAKRAAAVKIQAAFRGYLARRALKALKALVKLQALVRGNIVRKQAAETLRCMHALVRVQARARACRALRSEISRPDKSTAHPHLIPQTPEKFEPPNVVKAKQQCALERNSSTTREDSSKTNRVQATGWNWLDRWMEERYWDRRENPMDDETDTKILEIDNGKPNLNPKHKSSKRLSLSAVSSDHNSHSFNTLPDTPSDAQKLTPSPSSTHDQSPSQSKSSVTVEAGDFVERLQLHSTSSNRYGTTRSGSFTPVKSECARSLFSEYSDHRNYMADTESSRAKARSQSAPKQRPELEKSGSIKRTPSHGLGQPSSSSLLQCKFTKVYPGSGRLDRLGMPIRV